MSVKHGDVTFRMIECELKGEGLSWAVVTGTADGGEVVASCQLDQWETRTPFLCRVFVRSDVRRKGIGRAMVEAVIGECRGRGKHAVSMWVHHKNVAAQELYRKLGFEHYFTNGDNRFMSRLVGPGAQ